MEEHLYHVNLEWKADRKGEISSPVLNDKLEVATPPEFPKGMEGIWSPEHLFTAAVSSCFMTTFLAIAENSKLDFKDFSCPAKGKLSKLDGKFAMSQVVLEPVVTITNDEDREKAEKIIHKAERACLITNSLKSEVILKPVIQMKNSVPEFS